MSSFNLIVSGSLRTYNTWDISYTFVESIFKIAKILYLLPQMLYYWNIFFNLVMKIKIFLNLLDIYLLSLHLILFALLINNKSKSKEH